MLDVDLKMQLELAATFLNAAADKYANHGCNDWKWPDDWGPYNRSQLMSQIAVDSETFETAVKRNPPDWLVMQALAASFKKAIEEDA